MERFSKCEGKCLGNMIFVFSIVNAFKVNESSKMGSVYEPLYHAIALNCPCSAQSMIETCRMLSKEQKF